MFGETLRAARLAAGLSQADVARACGCSAVSVSRWETGDRWPKAEHFAEVLEALPLDPERRQELTRQFLFRANYAIRDATAADILRVWPEYPHDAERAARECRVRGADLLLPTYRVGLGGGVEEAGWIPLDHDTSTPEDVPRFVMNQRALEFPANHVALFLSLREWLSFLGWRAGDRIEPSGWSAICALHEGDWSIDLIEAFPKGATFSSMDPRVPARLHGRHVGGQRRA